MNNPPREKFRGAHFKDPFKEWVKGYTKRDLTTRDATELSIEVRNYVHDLFPLRRIPVQGEPSRYTLSHQYFSVKFDNGNIQSDLSNYFESENRYNNNIHYSGRQTIAEFFETAFFYLLIDAKAAFGVEWQDVQLGNRKFTLPSAFSFINTATLNIKKTPAGEIVQQRYSLVSKLIEDYFIFQDRDFPKEEVLIFNHPNTASSPVAKSLKYIKALKQGMIFSLIQGEANNDRRNHSFELEMSRYYPSSFFWREQKIARAKVKRIFNQPVAEVIEVTEFYDVFAFIEYKKHLNNMREYLVTEFNNQVMAQVGTRNGFRRSLKLTYEGFKTNDELSAIWEGYKMGKISRDELPLKFKEA